MTIVKASAAAYIAMRTRATTTLTVSRSTNRLDPVARTNSAGMSRPVTASMSEVECTLAAAAL